jgi:uncharacterized protein
MITFSNIFILIVCLSLGLASGFVMHRSDFCIAGMFRDLFLFGSVFKLRSLLLLVVSSMVMFEFARLSGILSIYPFPLFGSPSLANSIGGFIFGIGMVLAGGCVVGSLYKMGSGSILSAVACAGLIAGSAIYAEIHPWWSSLISKTTYFKGKVSVPQILGIGPFLIIFIFSAISLLYLRRCFGRGLMTRPTHAEGALQPWKAALLLSLIGLISCVFIGMPLGITTAYAKIAAYVETIFSSAHVSKLAFFQLLPLNYRQPFTGMPLVGGPGPRLDAIAMIQFPLIIGIVLGSTLSSIILKEFRIYAKAPLRQYISVAIGGIMMGLASRMTPACNIWHLMGGLPILAAQSLLFLVGLLPGAWIGSVLLSRVVIK